MSRASDAERHAVVDRLRGDCGEGRLTLDEFSERVGQAYAARTAAELDEVVADLPVPASPPSPARPATRRLVSVLGSARQGGRWRAEGRMTTVAVLGSATVDLCEAEVDGDELEVRVVVVFGGVEVVVPEGVPAELTGTSVLGSREVKLAAATMPGMPLVRVHATTVLGGVTVRARRFRRGLPGRRGTVPT